MTPSARTHARTHAPHATIEEAIALFRSLVGPARFNRWTFTRQDRIILIWGPGFWPSMIPEFDAQVFQALGEFAAITTRAGTWIGLPQGENTVNTVNTVKTGTSEPEEDLSWMVHIFET